MTWPIQMNPSKSSWQLWNKTIKISFGIKNNNKLLPHLTLDKWIVPHSQKQLSMNGISRMEIKKSTSSKSLQYLDISPMKYHPTK